LTTRAFWLRIGWAPVLLLALLPLRWPPDGNERADLAQFLGRFHPLLVHAPIVLIALVAILEWAACSPRQSHLRPAAGLILALAAISAIAAAFDGWLLAWSGAFRGHTVIRHMWGGVALAAVCMAAWSARKTASPSYRLWLAGAVVLMVWTGHEGGKLSHGDNYLTQFMPGRLRSWIGAAPPPRLPAAPEASAVSASSAYAVRIDPLFERSCVSCHGPDKMKGGLRLDTFARLAHGGEDGPVVAPWDPGKSELLRRVTLAPDDDDFMPHGGKKPLSPAEIRLLERWISAGASEKQPASTLPAETRLPIP